MYARVNLISGPFPLLLLLISTDSQDSYNGEWAESNVIAHPSPDVADRSARVHMAEEATQRPFLDISNPTTEKRLVYWRGWHPRDQSVSLIRALFVLCLSLSRVVYLKA